MLDNLQNLPRSVKQVVMWLLDTALIVVAYLLAFPLRFNSTFELMNTTDPWIVLGIILPIGAVMIYASGLPRHKLTTLDTRTITWTGMIAVGLLLVASMIGFFLSELWLPRSIPFIFAALYFVLSVLCRLGGQRIMTFGRAKKAHQHVLIYGAGAAGIQLAGAMEQTPGVHIVGFIDDNERLSGAVIKGLPVWHASRLEKAIDRKNADTIALAIPSLSNERHAAIIKHLSQLKVHVLTLPSFEKLLGEQDPSKVLRPVSINDILGRNSVDLNLPEIAAAYAGKTVMVTGAGGSIGSELCRQLIGCGISGLVAFDHSEFALYALERELGPIALEKNISFKQVLGSVTNADKVENSIAETGVQILLHAAAYKHVPIVEENEVAGLQNNVLGTRTVARAAEKLGIERFILISTDKAVRPTNIMGASKRLAELVVQDLATRSKSTIFSMVRFGNVLGSSGSVIPLFEKQIKAGGPVTVTHPDITRFFMTISEASRLVLLAGSHSVGGEVFVLDMGTPVKIIDLARDMITLSGFSVKDQATPDGDIEIKIVGMRPGEKLYEELLIGDTTLPTPYSDKILRAKEDHLTEHETAQMLAEALKAIDASDGKAARSAVKKWVAGYHVEPTQDPALKSI